MIVFLPRPGGFGKLVAAKPDEVEPDGAPNARGIPRSTLQSNIWYHLGLAQYLAGDFDGILSGVPVINWVGLQAAGTRAGVAEPGDVILLSPACSSYDMFKNYEERGDSFRAAVEAM